MNCVRCRSRSVLLTNGDYGCHHCGIRFTDATVKMARRIRRMIEGNPTGESYYSHRLRDWVPANNDFRNDLNSLGCPWSGDDIATNDVPF